MMSAVLRLEENDDTDKILKSLYPEAEKGMRRVKVKILSDLPGLKIEAEDSRSLRAALNSYLRWMDISEQIGKKFPQ